MRQFPVASLILLPTLLDARIKRINTILPLLKMRRQRHFSLDTGDDRSFDQLHIAFAAGFEPINLAPESGLAPIESASIEKDRTADLTVLFSLAWLLQNTDGDEAAHAPVPPEHASLLIEIANIPGWHFQDQIQHGDTTAIIGADFAQGRRLEHSAFG